MYCLSLSRDVRNGVPRGFFRVDFSRPSSEKAFEGTSRKHSLRGAPARGPLPGSGLRPGHVQWRRQRASGVTSSTCRFRRWEGEGRGRGVTTGGHHRGRDQGSRFSGSRAGCFHSSSGPREQLTSASSAVPRPRLVTVRPEDVERRVRGLPVLSLCSVAP